MVITLEVVTPDGEIAEAAERRAFDSDELVSSVEELSGGGGPAGHPVRGTIGRNDDNDWVLYDAGVSRHHAAVIVDDGRFCVVDRESANGVFVNSDRDEDRLAPHTPHPLASGDTILLGPYEIRVSVTGGSVAQPEHVPSVTSGQNDPFAVLTDAGVRREEIPGDVGGFADVGKALDDGSPWEESHQLAQPQEILPENWWEQPANEGASAPSSPPAQPPPPPAREPQVDPVPRRPSPRSRRPAVQRPAADDIAAAFQRGLGLGHVPLTPELAESYGQVLRVVVEGVWSLMKVRGDVKQELRLDATRVGPTGNNSLKWSPTPDEALEHLFAKRSPAYLPPLESFEEAFRDLGEHQVAVLAGMKRAFDSMLEEFDPDRLEAEFNAGNQNPVMKALAKRSLWDQYREKLRRMNEDRERTVDRFFKDVFGEGYEGKIDQIKQLTPKGPGDVDL